MRGQESWNLISNFDFGEERDFLVSGHVEDLMANVDNPLCGRLAYKKWFWCGALRLWRELTTHIFFNKKILLKLIVDTQFESLCIELALPNDSS